MTDRSEIIIQNEEKKFIHTKQTSHENTMKSPKQGNCKAIYFIATTKPYISSPRQDSSTQRNLSDRRGLGKKQNDEF